MAYTTLDPAFGNLSNGNLTLHSASGNNGARSLIQIPTAGKTHVEVTIDAIGGGINIGIANSTHPVTGASSWPGSDTNSLGWSPAGSNIVYGGSTRGATSPVVGATTGDTVAIEVDEAARQMSLQATTGGGWAAIDFGSTWPVTGPYYILIECDDTAGTLTINFGASTFLVTPSSGFTGLSDGSGSTTYILMPQAVF